MTLLSFGLWISTLFAKQANLPIVGFILGFILMVIPIGLPSLFFVIYLTRPKVKEQFK